MSSKVNLLPNKAEALFFRNEITVTWQNRHASVDENMNPKTGYYLHYRGSV